MAVAFFTATVAYLALCVQHMLTSTIAPSANIQIPRFVVGDSASQFVGLFAIGIIFLAFDIRARDVRDRISGIIDAKPVSNLELVVGRLGGILILLCIPMLVFLGLVLMHGALAGLAGWSFGAPIDIWSVLSFLTWDVVPNLAWWGGLVMFLAVILRNRLLVVLTALGIFALNTWFITKLSWGHMEVAGALTSQVIHPSDVAPVFATGTIVLQRVAWMLLSIGFLLSAAALLPRLLPRRGLFGLSGVGTFGAGILVLVGMFQSYANESNQKDEWVQLHQMQEITSFPDVKHLSGEVIIKPGNRIELNLSLTVAPPQLNTTDHVTFSLNPGYVIKQLTLGAKEIDDYTFQDGLLTIPAQHFGVDSVVLAIEAVGKPDHRFAYLDARIDLKAAKVLDFRMAMVRFLGNKSYVFQPTYVALLPGISWYPSSGVAVGRDDLQNYPRDYFTIDLTVTVPKNWLVAGPGKSELETGLNRRTSYRFRPTNPVIDVALIGSKFERVAMTVHDIEFELLYSTKHRSTFAAMEPLLPQLQEWISDRLEIAEQYGLRYPYETLTLVEVPSYLRVLGGGWSMDSTLFAPGVVMIRETGLPTARFDVQFKQQEGEQSFRELLAYVDNDLQGGNPLNGIARNFVTYQMSPIGRGAIALNYFFEDLVGDLLVERLPYYTTSTALSLLGGAQFQTAVGEDSVSVSIGVGNPGEQPPRARSGAMIIREQNIHNLNSRSKVEESSVSDLNFHAEPIESYDAVLLRSTYALAALKEWTGEETLGSILRDLLQKYRGLNFSYEEFREIATVHEPRFEDITQNWLSTNRLPGFIVSEPTIERQSNDDPDNPIFQTVFSLRNAEQVPGVVKVHWREEQPFGASGEDSTMHSLPPFLIEPKSSYQLAIKSTLKPTSVTIDAPMSLNRVPIELKVPSIDDESISTSNPLPDITPVDWNPIRSDQVIVDDLDPGFSVSGEPKELQIPQFFMFFVEAGLAASGFNQSMDHGLPVIPWGGNTRQWTRVQGSGFGRYRNTFAQVPRIPMVVSVEEMFAAEFAADLLNTGLWALEYSVPSRIVLEAIGLDHDDVEQEATEGNVPRTPDKLTLALNIRANGEIIPIELDIVAHGGTLETTVNYDNGDAQTISYPLDNSFGPPNPAKWVALGSFDITDTHVTVEVSSAHTVPYVFADAVRWTYVENGESD